MSVLTKEHILREIKKGRIKVEPFDEGNVGPASIDLTLSNEFRKFKKDGPINVTEDSMPDDYTDVVQAEKIKLEPGEFMHGITEEKITLPENLCGFLHGRSRFARLGLLIHATASLIQPGISNRQVFEIKNVSPRALVLKQGLKIGQLILMETKGKAKYEGVFKDQESV